MSQQFVRGFVAPLDVILAEDTLLQPDVLVARTADLNLPAAPELAVEVLSHSTRGVDLLLKRERLQRLVAWLAPQTPVLKSVLPNGEDVRSVQLAKRFTLGRARKRSFWQGNGAFMIAPTGWPWSVWLFWNADGSFRNVYVNLEQPHVRDSECVYTRDHVLDLIVYPDRRVVRQDEDEFADC